MTRCVVEAMTRAICWTAGLVEGMVAGVMGTRWDDQRQSTGGGGGGAIDPFGELRAALLGRDRRQIIRALGAPPTASVGFGVSVITAADAAPTFWQAPTWYYPFDDARRQAIAIRFVGNRARDVDFIGGGGGGD
jgi:hypothetical protein